MAQRPLRAYHRQIWAHRSVVATDPGSSGKPGAWMADRAHRAGDSSGLFSKSAERAESLAGIPSLAALFDIVEKARRAPLLSAGRLRAIWRLNTGEADRLANAYRAGVRVADSVPGSAQNAGHVIHHGSLRDDFASGYFVDAEQTWISPDFRMTLTRPQHGEVLVVGWLPDVLAYPGGRLPYGSMLMSCSFENKLLRRRGSSRSRDLSRRGALRQLRIVSAQRATGGGDRRPLSWVLISIQFLGV